jgi:hypothetical protein
MILGKNMIHKLLVDLKDEKDPILKCSYAGDGAGYKSSTKSKDYMLQSFGISLP